MQLKIEGLDNFKKDLAKAASDYSRVMTSALRESAEVVQQTARQKVAVKTGALRLSIGVGTVTSSRAEVVVGQPYGVDIEFGTKAHEIFPKKARALAFMVGGKLVFARKVNHPGTKAQPFMEPSLSTNVNKILSIISSPNVTSKNERRRKLHRKVFTPRPAFGARACMGSASAAQKPDSSRNSLRHNAARKAA